MTAREARNEVYVAVATGTACAPIAAAAFGHSWVVILIAIPCGALVGLLTSVTTLAVRRRRAKPVLRDRGGHISVLPGDGEAA